MITVAEVLPEGQRTPEQFDARIASAYGALFSGQGSREDADLVLVDMARFSRYYDTASLDMTSAQAVAFAHRRAVFSRVLEALTFAGQEPRGLIKAVLLTNEQRPEEN